MTILSKPLRIALLLALVAAEVATGISVLPSRAAAAGFALVCTNEKCVSISPASGCTYHMGTLCANYDNSGTTCSTQSCIPL